MTNSKYLRVGAGWIRNNSKGNQFISLVFGDKQAGTKLFLRNAAGEEVEVSNAVLNFVESKKNEKQPDVSISLKLE